MGPQESFCSAPRAHGALSTPPSQPPRPHLVCHSASRLALSLRASLCFSSSRSFSWLARSGGQAHDRTDGEASGRPQAEQGAKGSRCRDAPTPDLRPIVTPARSVVGKPNSVMSAQWRPDTSGATARGQLWARPTWACRTACETAPRRGAVRLMGNLTHRTGAAGATSHRPGPQAQLPCGSPRAAAWSRWRAQRLGSARRQPTLSGRSTEHQLCTQIPGPLRTALWGVIGC